MRRTLIVVGMSIVLAIAGCSAANPTPSMPTDSDSPSPSPSPSQALVVPSEPEHPPYVPSTFFPPGTTGPGIWDGQQVPIVVAASIDGMGYPLPRGAEYEWHEVDPSVGFEIGTIESSIAIQWQCAWLLEWDAALEANDERLVAEIEALLEQFWTLPHIALLTSDEGTFREQQTAAAPAGADLNRWFLGTLCG